MEFILDKMTKIEGTMQDVEGTQSAMARELKALASKSDDLVGNFQSLRGEFAGLKAALQVWFAENARRADEIEDLKQRVSALEARAS